ncbi:hypothetical protein [Burkholderia plantarii]|uniref:hypothetical protein n=1 Tax=Burkholderia plantarii TaxID=41899 RepID=UPI001495ECAA|nr:hypothetical protein [Burkholderia plantarii]
MPGRKPVSYTHLDVYKRQEQGRGAVGGEPFEAFDVGAGAEACLLYTSRCV